MELLGVVAIIGILCALTAVGVVAYNRSLKVMELNNTAEEIYIAAQNHLTALRTNATAEKALKDAGYGTRASDVSSDAPADLTASDKAAQWNAIYAFGSTTGGTASGSTVSGGASSGTAGAASGAAGSTADLSGIAAGVSGGTAPSYAQIAAYVLPAGAVDGTVAGEGNSYIVEYNPSTYTIYGVFYADGKSSVLGRDTGETISVSDLGALNQEVKADGSTKITSFKPQNGSAGICVGYYGGSSAAGVESHKLNGSIRVKLVNAEKLYAEITTKDLAVNGASATDNAKKNIRLWITVTGKTSGAVKSYGCSINAAGDTDSQKTDSAWKEQGKPVKGVSGITRQLVLDDVTTSGCHFAEIFGNGKSDNGLNFIPGEDVSVSAAAEITGSLSNIVYSDNTQTTNSLFASLAGSANGKTTSGVSGSGTTSGGSSVTVPGKVTETVTVMNFRHLENLSPAISHVLGMTAADDTDNAVSLTQISEDAAKKNTYQTGRYSFLAVLGKDLTGESTATKKSDSSLSWKGFLDQICVLNSTDPSKEASKVSVYYCGQSTAETPAADKTAPGSYAPVSNNCLSGFDGQDHIIEGVTISDGSDNNPGARGLFGIVSPVTTCTIKNMTLRNFDITAAAVSNEAEPENTGKSGKNNKIIPAGSLAGLVAPQTSANVSISNVTVLEKNSASCGIWGSGENDSATVCGGLIGEVYTAGGTNVSVDRSSASVYVKSAATGKQMVFSQMDIAGGLIGVISNTDGTVNVTNSYAGGHTKNAQTPPYYAETNKTRGNVDTGWNITAGNAAGGLIGGIYTSKTKDNSITIRDVYSTASVACVDSNNNVIKQSDVGGLIGYISSHTYNTGKLHISNGYSTGLLKGENKGGIAGYIALAGDTNKVKSELTDEQVNNALVQIFSNCVWLKGVNDENLPCATVLSAQNGNGYTLKHPASVSGTTGGQTKEGMTQKTTTDLKNQRTEVQKQAVKTATPYDKDHLSTAYDFRLVTDHHYGDWPKVSETEITRNGNRLMVEVDTPSDFVIIRLTGLQSGEHVYVVLYNVASNYLNRYSSNKSGVYVAKDLEDIITYKPDGDIDYLEGKNGKNINAVDYQSRLKVTASDDSKHYSLMLDNISGNQDNFLAFCQNTNTQFYYGEYLNIRISDQYTKGCDPKERKYCMTNGDYVVNSLFEDVFDPYVSAQKGALSDDGTYVLDSEPLKDSIRNLTFNGGKDLPDDISSAAFKPRTTSLQKYVAVIKNARHLENLDSILSGINTQDRKFNVEQAVQGSDIVWKQAWSGDASPYQNAYPAYVDELIKTNGTNGSNIYETNTFQQDGCFKSIHIKEDNELLQYDGNGYKIAGLKLKNGVNDGNYVGLFSQITTGSRNDRFSICDLELTDVILSEPASSQCYGTFVAWANRNITLDRVRLTTDAYGQKADLYGQNDAGGLIGMVTGASVTVMNSEISLASQKHSLSISAHGNSGGLIGIADRDVALKGNGIDAEALDVKGSQCTGGLIGSAGTGAASTAAVIIDDCRISADDMYIGGSQYTGGLAGIVKGNNVEITNSSFTGDLAVVHHTANNNSAYAGGLVGIISTPAAFKLDNCYASTYVYAPGAQAAGGLIGCLQTSSQGDTYSPITNCYVSGRTKDGIYTATTELSSNLSDLRSNPIVNVYGGAVAGGLIGYTDQGNIRVENSFSTASVCVQRSFNNNTCYAGGLIGYAATNGNHLQVSKSYATGLVMAEKDGNKPVVKGSLIGQIGNEQNTSLSDDYVIGIVNPNMDAVGNSEGLSKKVTVVNANNVQQLQRSGADTRGLQTKSYDSTLLDETGKIRPYPYEINTSITDGNRSYLYYDGDWPELTGADVKSITLSDDSLYLAVGDTASIQAVIAPYAASDKTVTWSSDNVSIVEVSTDGVENTDNGDTLTGKITAKAPGTAQITASVGDQTASCTVNVIGIQNGEYSTDVTGQSISMLPCSSLSLNMTGIPEGTSVSWSVDNNAKWFASVTSEGVVTIRSTGGGNTAQITATADINGRDVTASVNISVVKLNSGDSDFAEWDFFNPLDITTGGSEDTRIVKAYYDTANNLNVYVAGNDGCMNVDGYQYLKVGDRMFRLGATVNQQLEYWSGSNWQYADYHRGYADSDGTVQMEFLIPVSLLPNTEYLYLQPAGSVSLGNDEASYTTKVSLPLKG